MEPKLTIKISAEELAVMENASFFQHKYSITKKVYKLFATLKEELRNMPEFSRFPFPAGTDLTTGKISRGENYKLLPYIILDYPRLFSNEDIFAYRSMFWWGNYFLFTLHLSGESMHRYLPSIIENAGLLKGKDIYISHHKDEWQHALESPYFLPAQEMTPDRIRKIALANGYIKLGRKCGLNDWERMIEMGKETFSIYLSLLKS